MVSRSGEMTLIDKIDKAVNLIFCTEIMSWRGNRGMTKSCKTSHTNSNFKWFKIIEHASWIWPNNFKLSLVDEQYFLHYDLSIVFIVGQLWFVNFAFGLCGRECVKITVIIWSFRKQTPIGPSLAPPPNNEKNSGTSISCKRARARFAERNASLIYSVGLLLEYNCVICFVSFVLYPQREST